MRIYYILGSFLNLIVQQTFSNPHNTPFKEWQNWFLSTNLWHFSGRKTFHLFWNIIVHRVCVCGWVRTILYTFLQVDQSFIYWKMHANSILDISKKKSCSHWSTYIFFSSNNGKWKNAYSQDEKYNFAWWLSLYILYLWSKCNKIREKP